MSEKFKPDYRQVKENINTIKTANNRLTNIVADDEKRRGDIAAEAEKLRIAIVYKMLSEIDIEDLNQGKQGIRTKALRSAGYRTIADVVNVSKSRLEQVDGIGEQSAQKIKEIAGEILRSAAAATPIRLTAGSSATEETLLKSKLYEYKALKPLFEHARRIHEETGEDVVVNLKNAKRAQGRLRWLFAGPQAKADAQSACVYLEQLINSGYASDIDEIRRSIMKLKIASQQDVNRDFEQNSASYYTLLEELGIQQTSDEKSAEGLSEEFREEIEKVELDLTGLKCDLRKYQFFGVKYILNQGRVLLGDEMGLGKTVQAIASMVALRNSGENHFLTVCPASVLLNWCRETKRFCDIDCLKIHGKDAQNEIIRWKENGGVAVTTYETLAKFSLNPKFRLGLLIVDEAHYIKNPNANRTKNLLQILGNAQRVLFMTGTALENRVSEMSFLINCLRPDIASKLKNIQALSGAPQFRQIIAPVYFRRTRENVLTELPDLIQKEDWCQISRDEEKVYFDSESFMALRQVSFLGVEPDKSSKLERLCEICEEAKENGRKVLVFSFFINTIEMIQAALGNSCLGPISGSVSPNKRQEIIDEFDKAPGGTVLLSQIQAGGTGLNIQSASIVILCEPQIKPSIEHQAISRAYRMGQVNNVVVHRLLADETIDERIMDLLKEKQLLFDNFADVSVSGEESLSLSESSLNSLYEEEMKRIKSKADEVEPATS